MPAGTRFDWHTHEDHQLAWAASGVLTVLTAEATWVLPPTRALWIPAGLPHETASDGGRATMRSLYIRPGLFRVSWDETGRPAPVAASGQPGGRPRRPRHPQRVRGRVPP
jgi:quercetin dioxygenase-like cupin family protein